MPNPSTQPVGHPTTSMLVKYGWLSLGVVAVVSARAMERKKKGDKWHEQLFQVANDLGIISFPITAVIMIYELGKTQQEIQTLQQTQTIAGYSGV